MTTASATLTPPSIPSRPIVGALPAFLKDRIGFVRQAAAQGDVVDLPLGPLSGTLVTHPDLVKVVLQDSHTSFGKNAPELVVKGKKKKRKAPDGISLLLGDGLVTSNGDQWLTHRRTMQPAFHRQALDNIIGSMAGAIAASLDAFPLNGRTSIQRHVSHMAMEVAARTFFGTTVHGDAEKIRQAVEFAIGYISRREFTPMRVPATWPTRANKRFAAEMQELDALVYAMIAEHKERSEPEQPDLLDLLIHARDEETGEGLSDQHLRDQVVTMFVAGFETTAIALTWAWALLGRYPELLAKVSDEADAVLGGRLPTAADVRKLSYTKMVVEETLRLYPPVWLMWRTAQEDVGLGDYQIPAGRRVYLSQLVTHRLPAFWDTPDTFRPDRFAPELESTRPRYAWFPFGGGPRQCIGNVFAVTEATLVLAMMCQRAHMIRSSEFPEPQALLSLKPASEVWFYATPR